MSTAWFRAVSNNEEVKESWVHASDHHILSCEAQDLLWEENGDLETQLSAMYPCFVPNATYVIDNIVYNKPIYKLPIETVQAMAKSTGEKYLFYASGWNYDSKVEAPFCCERHYNYVTIWYDPESFKKAAKNAKVSRARKPILMQEITTCIYEICQLLPARTSKKFAWMYSDHSTKAGRMDQLLFILAFVDLAYGKNKHRTLAPFVYLVKEWRTRHEVCQRLVSDSEAFVKFMNEEAKVKRFRARALGKPRSTVAEAFE